MDNATQLKVAQGLQALIAKMLAGATAATFTVSVSDYIRLSDYIASNTKTPMEAMSDKDKLLHCLDSIPTEAGTGCERKVIAAKMLPEAAGWTVVKKCELLSLDRRVWYDIIKKPGFAQKCVDVCCKIKGLHAPKIWEAFLKSALNGNVTAQLAYLREVGILKADSEGTTSIALNIHNNTISYDRSQFTDEQRKAQHANIGATFGRSNRFVSN